MDNIKYLIAFAPFGFVIWYLLKKYNKAEIDLQKDPRSLDRKGFYLIGAVLVFVVGATLVSMLN